jgi:GT2 family glycosyltransferase
VARRCRETPSRRNAEISLHQPVVRIQSVLYEPTDGSLDRYLRGVTQAVALLSDSRASSVDLCFADCSPVRTFDEARRAGATARFVASGGRNLHYRFLDANLGHGGGQNVLFEQRGDADFVLLLNPDVCASPRLLVELLSAMEDPSIGIAEARQIPLENQKDYDRDTGDTSWASGACSLLRASVLDEIGGFDTASFFLHCDDVDLSWRVRLTGRRVVLVPNARVFHDKRISVGGDYLASDVERYQSALATVLLAWKYSREDIAEAGLGWLESSGEQLLLDAAAEFRRRSMAGELPDQIDAEHQVGQFQTYAFADVRF